jgi:8-oxo-dGTP diphosphatase
VAAYAVIVRDERILLSRLAPRISRHELWTLPGGGLDHGEDPRDAVLREIKEETGLDAQVGETVRVYSAHIPGAWRDGQQVDAHALRIVYDGWVAPDAPQPRCTEVDGSTVDAAWIPIADVESGATPVVGMVTEALADHQPVPRQRVAAYALIRRVSTLGDGSSLASSGQAGSTTGEVLLTRNSALGPRPGAWTLPGGGLDHGEPPVAALAREVLEECGLEAAVGELIGVHDEHFRGTAPNGRHEDFHGVHLIFAATVTSDASPRVAETGGTTDAVAWVPVADVESGVVAVTDVVRHALADD